MWLFPITYLLHIGEEIWGGPGFAAWFSAVAGVRMTAEQLVIWNLIGWLFMTLGIVLVRASAKWRWVRTAIAGIVLINAVLHAVASLLTRSYSPGLITSVCLWVPLGGFTVVQEGQLAQRSTFYKGLLAVIVFHALLGIAFIIK